VRRSGDSLRITAQLIDTVSGAHLWADRVEGAVNEVFALQDRVTASVVGAILPTLEQAEIRRVSAKPPENLGAYEHYIRAMPFMYRLDGDSNERALKMLRGAIELDPDYGLALARAAECYAWKRQGGWWIDQAAETAEGCRLARRAIEAAPDDPLVLAVSSFVLGYVGGDPESAIANVERSLSLSTNVAEAWAYSAWARTCVGDYDLAQEHAAKAMRLSPLDPRTFLWKLFGAMAYLFAGEYERAADLSAKSLADKPDFMAAVRMYAVACAHCGRLGAAKAAVARLRQADPTLRVSTLARVNAPIRGKRRNLVAEGLRIAGLPE
jgi:tetratricopeptide (TPR) repeat protein